MKKWIKRIVLVLLALFVIAQFIRIDKTVPEYDKNGDFISLNPGHEKEATLLKNACYDCHSYETKYPWYAEIAPVSWLVGDHIEDGRKHLNFSIWSTYEPEKQAHKLDESLEEMEEGKMPDPGYVKMHAEANLSKEDKEALMNYLRGVMSVTAGGESDSDD